MFLITNVIRNCHKIRQVDVNNNFALLAGEFVNQTIHALLGLHTKELYDAYVRRNL